MAGRHRHHSFEALERYVIDLARLNFHRILRESTEAGAALPVFRDLGTAEDIHSDTLRFRVAFHNRESAHWRVHHRDLLDYTQTRSVGRFDDRLFLNECRRLWFELYEGEAIHRELAPRRAALQRLIEGGAPGADVMQAQLEIDIFEEHLRRHHDTHPIYSIPAEFGAGGGLTFDLSSGAVNYVSPRDLTHVNWRDLFASEMMAPSYFADEIARGLEEKYRHPQVRALELLRSWLTPAQLEQYNRYQHFDVKGSKSGKTYRIHHGRQMNVYELDGNHRRVSGWCFLPQGGLVEGDCMLAQKIALETDEPGALRVANRFGDIMWPAPA